MNTNRVTAWACGLIALILVVMVGKSCTDSLTDPKPKKSSTSTEADYDIRYPVVTEPPTEKQKLDQFGRPIHETETEPAEPITNEYGELVTRPEPATDRFGNIIEEPETVPATYENGEPVTEEPTPEPEMQDVTDYQGYIVGTEPVPGPTEKSTEVPTPPPGFGGFDHAQYDEKGEAVPTIPPDYVIVLE